MLRLDTKRGNKKSSNSESKKKSKSKKHIEQRVRWAHDEIVEETEGKETRFSELTFRQFVAGELEIILE